MFLLRSSDRWMNEVQSHGNINIYFFKNDFVAYCGTGFNLNAPSQGGCVCYVGGVKKNVIKMYEWFFKKPKEEQKNSFKRNFFNFYRKVAIVNVVVVVVSASNNQLYIFNAQSEVKLFFFSISTCKLFFLHITI